MNPIAGLAETLKTYLKDHQDNCLIPSIVVAQVVEELERQQKEILKLVEDYDGLLEHFK